MRDLTGYPDKELSLWVFNDPYFYNEIEYPEYLIALCREEFHFTKEQHRVLMKDIEAHNDSE